MDIDTPQVQNKIAKWTILISAIVGICTYFAGAKNFSCGLLFGAGISVLNYKVISFLLDFAMRTSSAKRRRVLSFVGYHARFWVLVVVLYLTIPKTHYLFGIGTFAGLLLPKIIMGVHLAKHTDDEWWNKKAGLGIIKIYIQGFSKGGGKIVSTWRRSTSRTG